MLWSCCGLYSNPQQIETVEYGFRLVLNKSQSCTTNPQLYDNATANPQLYEKSTANPQLYDKSYSLLHNISTANPQQIEQVEFQL
jgi:hypothetical protein